MSIKKLDTTFLYTVIYSICHAQNPYSRDNFQCYHSEVNIYYTLKHPYFIELITRFISIMVFRIIQKCRMTMENDFFSYSISLVRKCDLVQRCYDTKFNVKIFPDRSVILQIWSTFRKKRQCRTQKNMDILNS